MHSSMDDELTRLRSKLDDVESERAELEIHVVDAKLANERLQQDVSRIQKGNKWLKTTLRSRFGHRRLQLTQYIIPSKKLSLRSVCTECLLQAPCFD